MAAAGGGTGFIITNDGYVLTAYHVVEDATRVVVQTKKFRLAAKVVKTAPTNDVAVLKIIGAYSSASATNACGFFRFAFEGGVRLPLSVLQKSRCCP